MPIKVILDVVLYGTAVLLEEVGKVIEKGGVGVTISSQSGHRMPALTSEEDEQLALTKTEDLLELPLHYKLPIFAIRCMLISSLSAAMKNVS